MQRAPGRTESRHCLAASSRPGSQPTLARRPRRAELRDAAPGHHGAVVVGHGGGRVPRDAAAEQPAAGVVDADGEGEQRGHDGRVEVGGHGGVELVAQAGEGHRVHGGFVERCAGCEDSRHEFFFVCACHKEKNYLQVVNL